MSDTPLYEYEIDDTDERQNMLVEPINHIIEVKKVGTRPHVLEVRHEKTDAVD